MTAWTGPLADEADDLAECLWHSAAGKTCGNCSTRFSAKNAPAAIFGATKFFEKGGSHRALRFLCKACAANIRSQGPSPALVAAVELEIAGELLRFGPL